MTTRRDLLKLMGAGFLTLQSSPLWAGGEGNDKQKKPNIIFILADDMGWSDLGCYGGEIATPNLDRLAKGGIRFTQMHNTGKCFPSRACLLTGLYAQQCGMAGGPRAFTNAATIGDVLGAAEYRTLAAGKHHGTQNLMKVGFDRYFGLRDGACNYFNPGEQRPGEAVPGDKHPPGGKKRVWCVDDKTFIPYTPKEKDFYTTDYFTNYGLKYLDQYKDEENPFFLYLSYTAPHDPLQAWPKDIAKYENHYLEGYEKIRAARSKKQKEIGIVDESMPLSNPTYQAWDTLSEDERKKEVRRMAVYAAMIDCLDQNIGRVLQKLEAIGELNNTLIMFASDNGCSAEVPKPKNSRGEIGSMECWSSLGRHWANVSNTPFRYYKNDSYEGGICTPFIAHWPDGIKNPGRISDYQSHFIDIMATIVDVSGATYPKTIRGEQVTPYEGESLAPLFNGENKKREKPIFYQWRKGKAVMRGKWKAVYKSKWSLYDLEHDKTETKDVASSNKDILDELTALHAEWLERCRKLKTK